MFKKKILIIDDKYQRKSIWGIKDNVALIETILLDLIIPELFFWKCETNPDTGDSTTHIVDGQQRIKAIVDFCENGYELQEKYLHEEESKNKWGNKKFTDLSEEEKKKFWNYHLTIIDINQDLKRKDIIKMFKRLNLTDYNLNDQEKRNTNSGMFATLVNELTNQEFWTTYKLFNVTDVKRMKDREFCATILLLCKRGIIDQSKQEPLNQAYKDYDQEYKDAGKDKEMVLKAIDMINNIIQNDKDMQKFLRKKAQLYSLFSIIFPYVNEENVGQMARNHKENFQHFITLYKKFDNNYDTPNPKLDSESEQHLYDLLKQYKLASSEGLNKHKNRMIRFNVLKEFFEPSTPEFIDVQEKLLDKLHPTT
jgi:hypothetical protein